MVQYGNWVVNNIYQILLWTFPFSSFLRGNWMQITFHWRNGTMCARGRIPIALAKDGHAIPVALRSRNTKSLLSGVFNDQKIGPGIGMYKKSWPVDYDIRDFCAWLRTSPLDITRKSIDVSISVTPSLKIELLLNTHSLRMKYAVFSLFSHVTDA